MTEINYLELRGHDAVFAAHWAEKTWNASEQVRREFSSKEIFIAYCKAEAAGRVKIYGGTVQGGVK